MSAKLYRIDLIGLPPVYKTSKREVLAWFARNPGEGQGWQAVDALEELDALHQRIEALEEQVERWRSDYSEAIG